eukprot:CAMPEP_0171479842 /NCGR_PEP_ID=MMETSP0946-20130122/5688_1 /TAXON_ID=109269 /ORGANISM="Vaucheria litorea, Strain CCMP2940" /LENGTH=358 /DNA_ID=CAMNT_0012010895 /DNA_START=116 /DNA_END=1192 /DNA_ORIENTATION=-
MKPQVVVNPPEVLPIDLLKGSRPYSEITVENQEQSCNGVFKVKTTSPTRYVVQPTNGLIEIGQTIRIKIFMTEKDSSKLLSLPKEKLSNSIKDKFLIQVACVDEKLFEFLSKLERSSFLSELNKIWHDTSSESMCSNHILVRFRQPKDLSPSNEKFSKIVRHENTKKHQSISSFNDEYHLLQAKYTELVEYSENLLDSRDMTKKQFDETKKKTKKVIAERMNIESIRLKKKMYEENKIKNVCSLSSCQNYIGKTKAFVVIVLCGLIGWYAAPENVANMVDSTIANFNLNLMERCKANEKISNELKHENVELYSFVKKEKPSDQAMEIFEGQNVEMGSNVFVEDEKARKEQSSALHDEV